MDDSRKEYFMSEALKESEKALPACLPNPPVGCVIVKENKIISRGFTQPPGNDHAEAMTFRQLTEEDKDLSVFVTLEPCSFYGRTPSYAKMIVTSGKVKEVFAGIKDPHKKNGGAGFLILKEAGIKNEIGILKREVTSFIADYLIVDEK